MNTSKTFMLEPNNPLPNPRSMKVTVPPLPGNVRDRCTYEYAVSNAMMPRTRQRATGVVDGDSQGREDAAAKIPPMPMENAPSAPIESAVVLVSELEALTARIDPPSG